MHPPPEPMNDHAHNHMMDEDANYQPLTDVTVVEAPAPERYCELEKWSADDKCGAVMNDDETVSIEKAKF